MVLVHLLTLNNQLTEKSNLENSRNNAQLQSNYKKNKNKKINFCTSGRKSKMLFAPLT